MPESTFSPQSATMNLATEKEIQINTGGTTIAGLS
jgi:hypothetical protein